MGSGRKVKTETEEVEVVLNGRYNGALTLSAVIDMVMDSVRWY